MRWIENAPKVLFFLFARVIVLVILGMNVRRKELLPASGPAIVIANHNSHLDTLVLMSLFPLRLLPHIRPVAATDYFMSTRVLAWFSTRIIDIIPVARRGVTKSSDPLEPIRAALAESSIVIMYPEGTRGEPEQLTQFKRGIAHLAEQSPQIPIVPVFVHGLGKALPKGETLLVPFFCDVFVGEPLFFNEDKNTFMQLVNDRFHALASEGHFSSWD
jgi:1-acyl-sn-glycerol-3-phosphate acyltransferase